MRLMILMLDFALRDMRKSKIMFFLVSISIGVSATAIVATDSMLLGFGEMLGAGNRGWMGDIVLTSADDKKPIIEHVEELTGEIRRSPHVVGVSVRSYAGATLKVDEKWVQPYRVMGVNIADEAVVTQLSAHVIEGQFLREYGPPDQAVIGITLADFLIGSPYDGVRAHAGDEITLVTTAGETKKYTLSGVIDPKTFLPNVMFFLEKNELENVLLGTKNSEIIVLLDDAGVAGAMRDNLADRYSSLTVHTSDEEAGFVRDILETVEFISRSINRLLVLAVFLIVNIVIYINVMQRRRQIGIIKSMGASNFFVVGAYLTEALLFGAIAYALCVFLFAGIYAYSVLHPFPLLIGDFRMVFDSSQIVRSFVLVLAAVFLGGVLPAWKAARTNIIDVLRNSV